MEKKTRDLGFDSSGVKKVMRKRDYLGDMSGQIGLGIMANLVGQLTYFYTDKVGLAAAGIGICILIAKIVDAFTDILAGNMIDHSKGGNKKYSKWMGRMIIPSGISIILMFTVPKEAGQEIGFIYICLTNIILTAIVYTLIATPYSALMVVRTKSQEERATMGTLRAAGNFVTGMALSTAIIPITNMLGGTQEAWIKFGTVAALVVLLFFLICYISLRKTDYGVSSDTNEHGSMQLEEEDPVPLKEALGMLFRNKYWVIVLIFNLLISINFVMAGSAGVYYTKWIFGNENLVGIIGALSIIPNIVGFIVAGPLIKKLGIRKTIMYSLGLGIAANIVKSILPTHFAINAGMGLISTFASIPMMCLFGVLVAMTIDYNEYKYNKKMVAMSGGAIGFGSKVGTGLGTVILTGLLAIGQYDATVEVATTGMRYSIYAFSNWLPILIYGVLFVLFLKFDLEEKLPEMRKEIELRREII